MLSVLNIQIIANMIANVTKLIIKSSPLSSLLGFLWFMLFAILVIPINVKNTVRNQNNTFIFVPLFCKSETIITQHYF